MAYCVRLRGSEIAGSGIERWYGLDRGRDEVPKADWATRRRRVVPCRSEEVGLTSVRHDVIDSERESVFV